MVDSCAACSFACRSFASRRDNVPLGTLAQSDPSGADWALQAAVPFCSDQQKRDGIFTPHLTLAHFESRDAAEAAKTELLQARLWTSVTFSMADSVHVMRRVGGGGQFERAFTLLTAAGERGNRQLENRVTSTSRDEA